MTDELDGVPALVKKGLSADEAKLLAKWIEEGKPGLVGTKAERMGEIYCLGYSCQEMQKWFPEYPLEILLWARVHYKWDETRDRYRTVVQQETLNHALAARLESLRFLSDVLSATHVKLRREMLLYIADPDNNKPPQFLPNNIHTYGFLISTLKDIMAGAANIGTKDDDKNIPLVTVNVNQNEKPEIIISHTNQEDIRKALMDEVKKKKNG